MIFSGQNLNRVKFQNKQKARIEDIIRQYNVAWFGKNNGACDELAEELIQIGKPAIDYLMQVIQADTHSIESPMVEMEALRVALLQMGEPAIHALVNVFREPSNIMTPHVAAKTLSRFGDERVVLPLLEIAEANHIPSQVRFLAIRALGDLKNDQCLKPLIELLNEDDDIIVFNTVMALTNFDDPQLIHPLLSKMNHYFRGPSHVPTILKPGSNATAHTIFHFILKAESQEAFYPYLVVASKDQDPVVRNAAVGFLRHLGKIPYSSAEKKYRDLLEKTRKRMNDMVGKPSPEHKSRLEIDQILSFLKNFFADDLFYAKWGIVLETDQDASIEQLLACFRQIYQNAAPGIIDG